MDHLGVPQFLGLLVAIFAAAKLLGALAQRIGQPAVLGELLAGVVLGASVLGWVNPKNEALHLLAELGVVILLFALVFRKGVTDFILQAWHSRFGENRP